MTDYGGYTFSYILDIKMHKLVRTLYSQQLSLIRRIYKSLVYNDIFPEDISSAAIQKHNTQEYNDIHRLFDPYCRHGKFFQALGCHTISQFRLGDGDFCGSKSNKYCSKFLGNRL